MTTVSRTRLAYSLLALLAFAHICLSIVYAEITPYRSAGFLAMMKSTPWQFVPDIGAPDERQHANYVINILEGKGLPVYRVMVPDPAHPGQTIRNPNLDEMYEDHQAPLFYLLDGGFAKLTGLDAQGAQDPDSGRRLRFLNALFGACTVVGVYFLSFWGFGRKDIGLLAAAIAALLPMNLALSGAVSNDPLLFCICTWFMAVCVLGIRQGWNGRRMVLLGSLVGLGLLTKTTALALLPMVILAFLLRKPRGVQVIGSGVIALLLAGPWMLRNQNLYGDPLGLKSFQELFAGELSTHDFIAGISGTPLNHWVNYVGWFTARSFFGVFGYMDIFLNERGVAYTGPANQFGPAAPNIVYRLLMAVAAIGAVGFVAAMARKESRKDMRIHIFNGIFLAIITVLFIRYNISFFQGQARYFYPAIGPISVGLAVGAIYLAKSRKIIVSGAVVAILVLLNIYALAVLPNEFAKRLNPSLANQRAMLSYPRVEGSLAVLRPI